MRKIIAFLFIAALAAGTLWAGGKSQPSGSGTAPGKTEIRAVWWGDTKRHELYNKIIDEFQKANTDITVIREPTSWADYWEKLSIQTASGAAPDFLGAHPQYAADYVSRGVYEPLDKYVSDGIITTEGWQKGILDTGRYNGIFYMVPMGVTFTSVFVNLGAFEQLGVTPPGMNWSWEDMKTIGLQLRKALDAAGRKNAWLIGDASGTINTFRYYVRQNGRENYDAKGNVNFTLKIVEDWWTMWKEFRDLGIVPDPATSTEYANATLEDSLFSRDMVQTIIVPVNQYKLYCTTFPNKKVGIIRNPTYPGKAVGEFPEGAHFAVNGKTTEPKKLAAAKLINFWVNDRRGLALFGLDQGVPGNASLADAYIPNLDDYQKKIVGFVEELSKIGTPTIAPPGGASEIDSLFANTAERIQFGQMTPAQAAKEFYEKAVDIRKKAQ
ncbi:MAG: extracellular solute-binding protein [Treponema sp.]|jgi:multiple sugar transport system substrate-binding protein|nr:extracellular solute-binding protein [Treponema sp.]